VRILCAGGGPAGLWLAILAKKALPGAAVRVVERNRPEDTFGWGVVFSDETVNQLAAADPVSHERLAARCRRWTAIETHYRGARVVSTGHAFAAISRRELLELLHQRCRELRIELDFERELDPGELPPADLVVAADGANSGLRLARAEAFRPRVDWGACRFCWLGTDLPLAAFTFVFHESEHGLFQVHAYPFAEGLSTWIVECREEVWRRAGLARASEERTVEFCERLFAPYLDGHRLLANRSLWRAFPTVRCESWRAGNVVLLGDAAHTAHFSIGSGTKMAMEDAGALAEALRERGAGDVAGALALYEERRRPEVERFQRAAETSQEWFESSARYLGQPPEQFVFNLLTRSRRITYDNLRQRDPELVARVDAGFAARAGAAADPAAETPPPPMFTPFRLRGLELANRIVVSPMCQYSAIDGTPSDWHLVHLGSRAVGGAGLVLTEMTDVSPEGRITPACAGMYAPAHVAAWTRIVDFVHAHTPARIGMQLAHAGRKGSVRHPWWGEDVPLPPAAGGWTTLAPSPLPFRPDWPPPREMDGGDMERVTAEFARAARWCAEAGFDVLELHMAHGYLLSSFLSPLANQRSDDYGGSLHNRLRFPLQVLRAVRGAWPEKPILVRISASDWMADGSGMTPAEAVEVARALAAAGCDLVDVSSGGVSPLSRPRYGRMYQVPFAERIRHEARVPVAAVGGILGADHANTILAAGRADLVVMARPHLRDPYLTLHAADRYGFAGQPWPGQYWRALPAPAPGT
jgi:anthraniloyl-CoA monooxygenase